MARFFLWSVYMFKPVYHRNRRAWNRLKDTDQSRLYWIETPTGFVIPKNGNPSHFQYVISLK